MPGPSALGNRNPESWNQDLGSPRWRRRWQMRRWQRVKLQSTCVWSLICLGNTRSACRQLGLKLQVALTSTGTPQVGLEKVEKGVPRKPQRGHRMMHWTHRKEGKGKWKLWQLDATSSRVVKNVQVAIFCCFCCCSWQGIYFRCQFVQFVAKI